MWDALEPLTRTWPAEVRSAIRHVVEAPEPSTRRSAIDRLLQVLQPNRIQYLRRLLAHESSSARRVGLEILSRELEPNSDLVMLAGNAIGDRTIPLHVRVAATRSLLRSTGPEGPAAVAVLHALVRGLPRRRILDRIEPIAERLGQPAAFDVIRAELYDQQKLKCPRCGQMERRRDMMEHLWNRHLLLLDGHRARNSFQILDERLGDPDPLAALSELDRALLARGLKDDEALDHLANEARDRHESLCPKCFSFVNVDEPPVPPPANLSDHRLSASGCLIELNQQGWRPTLHIESPDRVVYSGPEPDRGWSPTTWRWLGVVGAALGVWAAALLPVPWHAVTGGALVAEGILLQFWARRLERRWNNARDRIIDLAWQRLVPELPTGTPLARIALASVGRGSVARRMEMLQLAIAGAETAARARVIPATEVAPLWWLQAEDQRRKGRDVLPTLAGRIGSCLSADVPMAAGGALCELTETRQRNNADSARLRVLVTEQAFVHGVEVWDLLELSRAFPALGRVIASEDLDGLARLRLLWNLRKDRPWASCGPAVTVFELARYPVIAALALATAPDVLLYQPLPPPGPGDDPVPLLLCGRGMVIGDVVVREQPDTVTVRQRETWRGGGYELRIDARRLHFAHDPDELADRIRRWAVYWFQEFLPQVDHVLKYRATDRLAALLLPCVTECGLCRLRHAAVPGGLGFAPTS